MLQNQNLVLLLPFLDLELLALLYVNLVPLSCVCEHCTYYANDKRLIFYPNSRLLKGQGFLVHQELLGLI